MANTFKGVAYEILKKAGKPLHSDEITKIALQKGWLKTAGKTPEATMNAQLVVDINKNGLKSLFKKIGPSSFTLNKNTKNYKNEKSQKVNILSEEDVKRAIIKWLSCNEWGHFKYDKLHGHGVDIKAQKNNYPIYYLIEAKKEGNNEVAFIYSLGQIITRMDVEKAKYKYGLGLPEKSAKIARKRLPWQVAKKLSLYVLSVDNRDNVKEYSWKDLRKEQDNAK